MKSASIGLGDVLKSIGGWRLKTLKLCDFIIGSLLARVVPGKTVSRTVPRGIKRLLVIRPGGIGDAIFLLPFLRLIKTKNPGITVDVLCEKRNAQIFWGQKGICDEIICYDQPALWRSIWKKRYDVIIDTEQWHYLSALVCYFVAHNYSIGFASRPLRKKLFSVAVDYQLDAYEIENFQKLFLPVFPGVDQIRDIAHSFILDEAALAWAQKQIPDSSTTLFLGASIPLRRLSRQQTFEIIHYALVKDFSVVLLGGGDVAQEGGAIVREIKDPRVMNFAGKISLLQTAALIKHSRFFIGPDSGIMHLACAVGTPVIALFGPGNLQKWGPKGERDRVVTLNLPCSPCTRFGYTVPTCGGAYQCMHDMILKKVWDE